MRHLSITSMSVTTMTGVLMLSGCSTISNHMPSFSGWKESSTSSDPTVVTGQKLPVVDVTKPVAFTDRLRLKGFSLGSWAVDRFNPHQGELFQPVPVLDKKFALVYLYRPHSRWNEQEILANSIFLNGLRLPSLLDNHYYWLEMNPGVYRLKLSRPIGPIYFQKGTVVDFQVEAGKTYYLRYDEQGFRGHPDESLGLLAADPIYQVPEKVALSEIRYTTLKTPGYSFVDDPDKAVKIGSQPLATGDFASFNGQEGKPVPTPVWKRNKPSSSAPKCAGGTPSRGKQRCAGIKKRLIESFFYA